MESKQSSREPYRLYLRDGIYYAHISLGGYRRIRRSLNTAKVGLARKRLSDLVAQVGTGELDQQGASISFAEWVKEYTDTHLNNRVPESRRKATRVLNDEVLPFIGKHVKLSNISVSQLIRMVTDLWGESGIPSRNRKIALVKHLFSEARRRNLLIRDPAVSLRKRHETPHKSRTLSDVEVQRLWLACGEPLKTFVLVAITAGLRPAELQQLRWKHIEPDQLNGGFKIHLVNAADLRTKSGKNREIPIHSSVLPRLMRLRGQRGPEDLVFEPARNGRHYSHRRAWTAAISRAGLTEGKVTLYSLRRSFGTNLQKRGASLMAIRDLYGHADVTMTQRYLDTSDVQLREAVQTGSDQTVAFLDFEGVSLSVSCEETA
jgi:integrase/recombinase XerD